VYRIDLAAERCKTKFFDLISIVREEEEEEIETAGVREWIHMKFRRWRTKYRSMAPDWFHKTFVMILYGGGAAVSIVKEVKGQQTETWIKATNGALVGLAALSGGVPLLFKKPFSRGYPFSFPQSFPPAQMMLIM